MKFHNSCGSYSHSIIVLLLLNPIANTVLQKSTIHGVGGSIGDILGTCPYSLLIQILK